jgi:cob(I)alamin adenosyltransferase
VAKIYTKTGDGGETSLLSGGRVGKDHPLVEAYGAVDELSSVLGLLLCEPLPDEVGGHLPRIQDTLLSIGSALADPERRTPHDTRVWDTGPLESWIDSMEAELEPLDTFILPGGSRAAALAHLARTVCRRAERRVSTTVSGDVPEGVLAYVNRLSDALFVLSRWINARLGIADRKWIAGSESRNGPSEG